MAFYANKALLLIALWTLCASSMAFAQSYSVDIVARVPGCGDGVLEVGEECDDMDFGGASCVTKGFDTGPLTCTASCLLNTTACTLNPVTNKSSGTRLVESQNNVTMTGRASPNSVVKILKDGQLFATATSDDAGYFQSTVRGISNGSYVFSFAATDRNNNVSALVSFPIQVRAGLVAKIYNILLPPTIAPITPNPANKNQVLISGYAAPSAQVELLLLPGGSTYPKVNTDKEGRYILTLDAATLGVGTHVLQARVFLPSQTSQYSSRHFIWSPSPVTNAPSCDLRADITHDCRVNLVDFTVASIWYLRPLSLSLLSLEAEKLNDDGLINLHDLSLMAYFWTG